MYAAKRYIDETKRLYAVYEKRLEGGREYLVGKGKGRFSTADAVTFPWIYAHPYSLGMTSLAEAGFPLLDAYVKRVAQRPAVAKALEGNMIAQLKAKVSGQLKKGRLIQLFGECAADGDGLIRMQPDWEEQTKKKLEWVYAKEDKPKDEL